MIKYIFYILISATFSLSCTSDCTSCHPSLDILNDERHIPLSGCVDCHPPESFSDIDMEVGCGTDCFNCHSVKTLTTMPQHFPIKNCISCHDKMTKNDLKNEIKNLKFLNENSLKNIIFNKK